MYCTNCGAQLESEARFCQECGTPVSKSYSQQGQTMQMPKQSQQQTRATYQAQQGGAARPMKTLTIEEPKRGGAAGVAIGILCALAVAAVAFFVLNPTGRTSGNSSSSAPAATASDTASEQASAASSAASAESASASSTSASSSAASSNAASKESSSASAESEEPVFDQAKAESQARQDAAAAGMQVLSGTVRLTTYGQRAAEIDPKLVNDFKTMTDEPLALLEFSVSENLTASSAGDQGQLQTRANQESIALSDPWSWADFDGLLVTVAAYPEDLTFPSDVVGALYSAGGAAELIAPLTEERAAALTHERAYSNYYIDLPEQEKSTTSTSSSSSATSGGDYVLADSATRAYAKSDLNRLSDYELFIARNEIYARHGRKFQSEELQKYFASKSWYKGTVDAASFDESILSDTELANASLILEVEQSRNSKYI